MNNALANAVEALELAVESGGELDHQIYADSLAGLKKLLVDIAAHDQKLTELEQAPTGDDYNVIIESLVGLEELVAKITAQDRQLAELEGTPGSNEVLDKAGLPALQVPLVPGGAAGAGAGEGGVKNLPHCASLAMVRTVRYEAHFSLASDEPIDDAAMDMIHSTLDASIPVHMMKEISDDVSFVSNAAAPGDQQLNLTVKAGVVSLLTNSDTPVLDLRFN